MKKMVNMTKIVKAAINGENGENRQRAGENFNKIIRDAPCKEETLTEW